MVDSTAEGLETPQELSVECPHGPVLSGGFIFNGEDQTAIRALRSYPVASNTWLVRASTDGEQVWSLTVTAVCQK